MEELLVAFARHLALVLQALALLLVAGGAVQAVAGIARLLVMRPASGTERRAVWLRFAHWLVAALTFQLAADIVETTVTPDWDEIGRVGAIAAIRTFLTYFLDRDIEAARRLQHEPEKGGAGADNL